MAQIYITLDQDEVLRLLAEDGSGAFKALLQEGFNALLRAESAEQLRAAPYERSEAALVTTMAEMVVAGASTAKVGWVMEEICGRPFSKQAVSDLADVPARSP